MLLQDPIPKTIHWVTESQDDLSRDLWRPDALNLAIPNAGWLGIQRPETHLQNMKAATSNLWMMGSSIF